MGRLDTNMKRANYNTGQLVTHKSVFGAEASLGADLYRRKISTTAQGQLGPIQVRGEGSSDLDLGDKRGTVSASTQRNIKGVDVGAHAQTDDKGNRSFSVQASKTNRSRKGDLEYGVRANNSVAELFFEYRPK